MALKVRRSGEDKGESVDLGAARLTLGQLATPLTADDPDRVRYLRERLKEGLWFAGSLGPFLKEFSTTRNAFTHAERLPRDKALPLRNRLMGIGMPGIFAELAKVEVLRTPSGS
jgi:hypothetical protein